MHWCTEKILALLVFWLTCQNIFASLPCEGTIYFKLPEGWRSAYAVGGGQKAAFTKSDYDGWLKVSATNIGAQKQVTGFFIEETGANDCSSGHCVRRDSMDVMHMQMSEAAGFKCADFSSEDDKGELWIQAHPDPSKEGVTYKSHTPPDVKYFYIFLPNNATWKNSIPMMSVDGKPGESLTADSDRCGWYFRRFIDEDIPSSVLIYRDDDEIMAEAIGMNGDWDESDTLTPINLEMLFDFLGSDNIYFVAAQEFADESNPSAVGWTTIDPGVTGDCGYELTALIYDTDASLHGAFTCSPGEFQGTSGDKSRANSCYYDSAIYKITENASAEVPCDGITTGMVTDILDSKTKKPVLTEKGKTCFGKDSEKAFYAMFHYVEGVNENYVYDLPFTQTGDGKYEFDSDNFQSPGAAAVGGFYPAEETPDAFMFVEGTKPLPQAESKRKAEGPVFMCADYNNASSSTPEGLRTIDASEGVPKSDLVCNGPGWDGGVDCDGYYAAGSEFFKDGALTAKGREIQKALGVTWEGDGWGWACQGMAPIGWTFYREGTETAVGKVKKRNLIPEGGAYRWVSGNSDSEIYSDKGRNRHYCFELHSFFSYRKGLRYSFSSSDDMWVYIDNKLAVDLGGTHLPASGYVNLDEFVGASGEFVLGKKYDVDIFSCDRRSPVNKVRIKVSLDYTKGVIIAKYNESENGEKSVKFLYSVGDSVYPNYLEDYYDRIPVSYRLFSGKGKPIVGKDSLSQGHVYFGGIDLTNPLHPKVNESKIVGLEAGDYKLVAYFKDSKGMIPFTVANGKGDVLKLSIGKPEFRVSYGVLSSTLNNPNRLPLYITAYKSVIPDDGNMLYYVQDTTSREKPSFSLNVLDINEKNVNDVILEVKDSTGAYVKWSGSKRIVGKSGVDTIYAYLPMQAMHDYFDERIFELNYGDVVRKSVSFVLPKLVFTNVLADENSRGVAVTGDADSIQRWAGVPYEFYLEAQLPSSVTKNRFYACGKSCNFDLSVGLGSSSNLVVEQQGLKIESGRAKIKARSIANTQMMDAVLEIVGPNAEFTKASYAPLRFKEPSVPYPLFADIFDVRGKKMDDERLPNPYFDSTRGYLDGIADSIVIYYSRGFFKSADSIPDSIVVAWDERNPVVLKKDSYKNNLLCGAEVGLDKNHCLGRIVAHGIPFSKDVKTANPNAFLISYKLYEKESFDYFVCGINDRVSPVIKEAKVYDVSKDVYKVVFTVSEPVRILLQEYEKKALSIYYSSSEKFVAGPKASKFERWSDSVWFAEFSKSKAPEKGDFVRFRADTSLWIDCSSEVPGTKNELRIENPLIFNWNLPTDYESQLRLASPWVKIENGEKKDLLNINIVNHTPSSFHVKLAGPLRLTIVLDGTEKRTLDSYVIVDALGVVVKKGLMYSAETEVEVPGVGAYIVKVGHSYRRVNLK